MSVLRKGTVEMDGPATKRAFKSIGALVAKHHHNGLSKAELESLVQTLDCNHFEKKLMDELIEQVDTDASGNINVVEWIAFVDAFAQAAMREGHVNTRWHCILLRLDMFRVSTWHDFERYDQVSWVGAFFGFALRILFVVVIVVGVIAFHQDRKTSMRQKFISNSYDEEMLSPFFFFFRTIEWENTLDPTLLSFQMSYYRKTVDASSGEALEDWEPVPFKVVGPADVPWWPSSITGVKSAVMPYQPIVSAGAYHLNHFQQLEVKLVPCQNQSGAGTVVCQSPARIRAAMDGASVNFVVQSTDMGFNTARTQYWTILMGQTKQIDLWFDRKVKTWTAKFPWMSDESEAHMPYTHDSQQILTPWSDGTLAVWWLSQSPDAMTETMVRQTVTDLFGELGGTWATLLSVFGLAALYYNDWRLRAHIEHLRLRVRYVEDLRIASRSLLFSQDVVGQSSEKTGSANL
mmetsp:Transcript_41183/g.116519  ORF Transcript_41183/g.116519 Transcript_41183/m.116519 type:complete len:461 (-) Transcript_41183:91-1473(-)